MTITQRRMETPVDQDAVLVVATDDGVLTVTLNRPAQRNAMTGAMEATYRDVLRAAQLDPQVMAVVVTGAGDAFCSGADFTVLGELAAGAATSGQGPTEPVTLATGPGSPLVFSKPLIGAINGACIGLGFAHALYCDVRFAAAGAKFSSAFARRGLIAEYGSAWLLPRIVGRANALDLLLSGRVILAEEALQMGLVQRVLPSEQLLPAAQAYARELAQYSSPTSMAVIKQQVNDDGDRDLETAMRVSLELMVESFSRPDLPEGVAAHVERRTPTFQPWLPSS